ncbi:MAG: VCBS repeat-containing protein [Pseudomonadota bacterium]
MKIASSDISLSSQHAATTTLETQEKLRAWIGKERPDFEGRNANGPANFRNASSNVQISDAGKAAQFAPPLPPAVPASSAAPTDAVQQASDEAENDPRIQLIKYIIELMTGRKINSLSSADIQSDAAAPATQATAQPAQPPADAAAQNAPPAQKGWGVEIDRHQSYTETEQTTFHSTGKIVTADNKEISFDLSFELSRSYHEESSSSVRLGDAKKVDPLVINFSGNSAQLTSQKFAFDLDADGKKENVSFVQGAGFLALDKNNDGKINNGSELFGPGTGNGFSELAAYDSDGNHWIDESDAIYQKLKVWTKDGAGHDQLQTLKQANVGALYLGNATTEFDLKNTQNQSDGQIRASGIWLSEDGKAHSLQQVDLSV